MQTLLKQIRNCKECEKILPLGANPIVAASKKSRIIIIGQAPGRIVHETGVPWNDKSGDNLRSWLGVDKTEFYDPDLFALIPMGFCYPGKGKSGDLPPSPVCAPLWHKKLLHYIDHQLILLVGQYAQNFYLGNNAKANLTETVHDFKLYLPQYFPLPHPSPRNNIWQKKNEWFRLDVLPELKSLTTKIIHR